MAGLPVWEVTVSWPRAFAGYCITWEVPSMPHKHFQYTAEGVQRAFCCQGNSWSRSQMAPSHHA